MGMILNCPPCLPSPPGGILQNVNLKPISVLLRMMTLKATQDSTTRLWDVRNTSCSFATLRSHMGAVRSLRFSPDGSVLAVAEPADFVNLYDVHAGYDSMQEVIHCTLHMLNPLQLYHTLHPPP